MFLANETLRLFFATFGLGLITGAEGRKAQSTWQKEVWSPRVIAHGLVAVVATVAFAGAGVLWVLALLGD